jgi:hypothetical protein
MSLIKYGHIIGRENNVVRVDFARESDPPAPKFPGASGSRPVKRKIANRSAMASIELPVPVSRRWLGQGNSSKTLKRVPA